MKKQENHKKPNFTVSGSSQGFTLLEIVLSLALSGLVMIAVFSFYSSYWKKFNQMSEELETSTDLESGQRILLKDLKNLDPSFGLLSIADDQGYPLLEYYPDVPDATLAQKHGHTTARTYTMKWNGGFREIVFLLHDQNAHEIPSMVYDPTKAYQITPGSSFNSNGSVTFRSVNWGKYIGDPNSGDGVRPRVVVSGTIRWPGYWSKGQLLMFDTPLAFRSEGQTDLAAEAPRSPAFVGRVFNGAIINGGTDFLPLDGAALDLPQQTNLLVRSHPVNNSYTIDSADRFLRSLPAAGGGQPMVRLRPVKLVKYIIEPMYPSISPTTTNPEERLHLNMVRLWKWTYTEGKWDPARNKFLLAEKLKTVQFIRHSINEKVMQFSISKNELKKGGEL